jgi:large subunit ribosomal protein L24
LIIALTENTQFHPNKSGQPVMQKLLRRAAVASNRAKRGTQKFEQRVKHAEKRRYEERVKSNNKLRDDISKSAIKAQREDWEMGNIAPRRNTGRYETSFAALDPQLSFGSEKPIHMRQNHHMYIGDRVVVVNGICKGRIGYIAQVHKEQDRISLSKFHTVCIMQLIRSYPC